jgi:ditrans,polycis-polyprenyl diphosphate synthase
VCYKSGVKVVTIYAFSIENFKRSKFEVDALMEMARVKLQQMAQHGDLLDRFGARVRVLGRLDLLRPDVLDAVNHATELTSGNGDRVLNICFPYTSRDEITTAIRETVVDYSTPLKPAPSASGNQRAPFSESHIALNIRAQSLNAKTQEPIGDSETASESSSPPDEDGKTKNGAPNTVYEGGSPLSSSSTLDAGDHQAGEHGKPSPPTANLSEAQKMQFISPETISRQTISDHLLTKGNPPLDLLIRTSGVERLSDFMLWQCDENTEIVFLDVMWPEFDLWHFLPVLLGWQRRIVKSRKNPDAEGNFDGDTPESYEEAEAMAAQGQKVKGL